jgi:hypothetical protein
MTDEINQDTHGLPPEVLAYLRTTHVHFCLPMYNGVCNEATFISMIKFSIIAAKLGINYSIDTMVNESLIPRGRNNLVAKFLFNQTASHLMFIDTDLGFDAESILRLLCANQDVVGGVYPMKRVPIRYVINTVPNPQVLGDLVEVSTLGTGFMLVKREVINNMIAAHPELKYRDNIGIGAQYEPFMYALFDTMIDTNGHYLSEDWAFCKRVREKLEMPIWVDTEIKLDHTGTYNFQGDVDMIKKLAEEWMTNIKDNKEQIKAYEKIEAELNNNDNNRAS